MPFDIAKSEYKIRVKSPKSFDRKSIRTVKGKCVNVIVGCPAGKYDRKKRKCRVGTQRQAIRLKKRCYTKSQAKKWARKHGVD